MATKTNTKSTTKARLEVLKTYKIFIGGAFPRTESGRYYSPKSPTGESLGNICLSSRKDIRNAVKAARKAVGGWASKSAFNRSQILYRIAEMLEGRSSQFVEELQKQGSSLAQAKLEVETAVDRLIYYAGWCDKYQQVFSAVNPVASSHFNFSAYEPMGVVTVLADEYTSLVGLVSQIAPIIAGGNSCIVLASESKPLCSVTFAEVVNTSDVPGGVINILTGSKSELAAHMASHMDVNAVVYAGNDKSTKQLLKENAVDNLKRVFTYDKNWMDDSEVSPYYITDLQEVKTTWHPIETIKGAGSGY